MDHVFGYVNFIDGSARGLKPERNSFFQMKSRATFAPIGPWIVTKDEIADPQNLAVRLSNNGEVMQSFNTSDMAHPIARCIEWVSSIHPLEPGDILATGTNHRGLNPFMDGDRIELEVEGCGVLRFSVRDDLKRTWKRETRLDRQNQGSTRRRRRPAASTPRTLREGPGTPRAGTVAEPPPAGMGRDEGAGSGRPATGDRPPEGCGG